VSCAATARSQQRSGRREGQHRHAKQQNRATALGAHYSGGPADCEASIHDHPQSRISATSKTRRRPANAKIVEVPEYVWSRNTSLTTELDTLGSPISPPVGWFDGTTLHIDGGETIFENGFD